MILLTATTDKIDLITGTAADVDVHASWMDYASGTVTPGRTNTAITTATTTDIVAAPGASTQRNIKRLNIRNKDSADSTAVTVRFNQNGTVFELHKVTLAPGDVLQYINDVGWFVIEAASGRQSIITNSNTGDVVANAADTYLTGSALAVGGRLRQGATFSWKLRMTKTAAGTAAPVYTIRVGTAGSTSDTGRLTFTGLAQTAATDTGYHEIEVVIDAYGASGTLRGVCLTSHQGTTTGLQNNAQSQALAGTSPSAHDQTLAGLIVGLSCNPGASGVWTFQVISARASGLAA